MTRHRIVNPKTGRLVFKTGQLGRKISTNKKKKIEKKPKKNVKKTATKPKATTKNVPKRCWSAFPGAKCGLIKNIGKSNYARFSAGGLDRAGFKAGTVVPDIRGPMILKRDINGNMRLSPLKSCGTKMRL